MQVILMSMLAQNSDGGGIRMHTFTFDLTASKPEQFDYDCSKFVNVLTSQVLDNIRQ